MYFIKAELYSSLQCNKATAIIKIHFLDTYYSFKLSQKERINMEQNLSTYRIFYEVAKSGNIPKAAEQLYISQPAISKTIVRLEDSLEIKLFKRNSRGVSLTDEGKGLITAGEGSLCEIWGQCGYGRNYPGKISGHSG